MLQKGSNSSHFKVFRFFSRSEGTGQWKKEKELKNNSTCRGKNSGPCLSGSIKRTDSHS